MNSNARPKSTDAIALMVFSLLALLLTAPALLSGGDKVCASNAPDTWVHMWAFWRTHMALHGHDAGYFLSHVITYPGTLREPIAIFDPLLSLLAAALQTRVQNIPTVFNLLVTLGLAFTGMAGYLLASLFTRRSLAALIGGIVAVANPFVYRQIAAGYTEYAWWGLVPFTAWLYLRAISEDGIVPKAGYVISLLLTFLLSIYCAAIFTFFAVLAFACEMAHALEGKPNCVRRAFRLQLLAMIALLPLLFFWFHNLGLMGYRGIPLNEEFSVTAAREAEARMEGETHVGLDELETFSTWRTLHGSLDAADLLRLTTNWRAKEEHRRNNLPPNPFLAGAEFAYFESVFAIEWLVALTLAVAALCSRHRQGSARIWLSGALLFLVFALGPFLVWNGKALTMVSLPYAWCYRWLPGFARLSIPGRAFFGTLLCLIVPVAQGADVLVTTSLRHRPGSARQRYFALALLLLASFSLTGYARLVLPTTPIVVPPVYDRIAGDEDAVALLELPVRGDLDARMFYQTIHGKPIYRGIPATFMTEIHGMTRVENNVLVQTLNLEHPRLAPKAEIDAALEALRDEGFHYLLLHADGYDGAAAYTAAVDIVQRILQDPIHDDGRMAAWKLTR